jgi:flagellar hook-length control protein FliK
MQIAPGIRVPVNLIAVNIAQHVSQGINKFELRLDPPELGRIEVKLEMTSDGKVSAHITAERAETLDLLQRDARALERALNDTGLSANRDSLSFSLKDQASNGANDQQTQQQNAANATDNDDTTDIAQAAQYVAYVTPDSVDIRI